MAVWIRSGTVTLTGGSKAVAGTGTAWLANVMEGDQFNTPTGPYEVESVANDGALQLATAYAGPTASNIAYSIVPTQGRIVPVAKNLSTLLTGIGAMKDDYQGGGLATAQAVAAAAKKEDLAASGGSATVGFTQQGTDARETTLQAELRAHVRASQFKNIDSTGLTDSTLGIATAIACVRAMGGGTLDLGMGQFLLNGLAGADGRLNGLLIPYVSSNGTTSRVNIVGRGKSTVLRCGSNNMTLARVSDSHCGISNVTYEANGKTGCWALCVLPENIAGTSSISYQLFNYFKDFYVSGFEEAIVMQCGPRIGGVDSGCWYNTFTNFHLFNCKRGVWLRNGPNANSSGVNANTWSFGRVGQNTNTGFQIDSGSGNRTWGVHFEGVNTGSAPNATPTAVKIALAGTQGGNNDNNQFYGSRLEACTVHLDNQNTRTQIFGGEWNAYYFVGVKPTFMLGGDPSVMPMILPGLEYAEGTPGYTASGYIGLKKAIVDLGFNWADWTLSNATARVSGATSVSSSVSKFLKLNDLVEWHFVVKFTAATAAQQISIIPPVFPNAALYCNTAGTNPFMTLAVEDGTGVRKVVEAGWLNGSRNFYVKSPGAWNTGTGDNNAIFATLRYHA